MEYTLKLTVQEIQTISDIIKEIPYKIAKPLLDKIAMQVEEQNKPLDNNQEA